MRCGSATPMVVQPATRRRRVRTKKGPHRLMRAFYYMRNLSAPPQVSTGYFALGCVMKPIFVKPPACAAAITSATRS